MKSKSIILFVFFLALISCKKDENITSSNILLIGKHYFNDYPWNHININNAEISGDFLTITFVSSCCDGRTWDPITNLVGEETILYSYPPQRNIRLSFLDDVVTCDMLCGKTVQFDISPTKLNGTNKIVLNLSGWNSQLIYSY